MTSRDTSKTFESFRKSSQEITTICTNSEVNVNIEIFWTNVTCVVKLYNCMVWLDMGTHQTVTDPAEHIGTVGIFPLPPLTLCKFLLIPSLLLLLNQSLREIFPNLFNLLEEITTICRNSEVN